MSEWVVKMRPLKVIALTEQGAYESAVNMLKTGSSSVRAHIIRNAHILPYKGTFEYYESMLDALQGSYGEYLMSLSPDEVNHMVESGQMFLEEEDIYE